MLEALSQPIFMEYQKRQPFNHNMLQPCPCLDNPQQLRDIVNASKARPTQMKDMESVEEFTSKCENAAKAWAPVAEKLWMGETEEITLKEKV